MDKRIKELIGFLKDLLPTLHPNNRAVVFAALPALESLGEPIAEGKAGKGKLCGNEDCGFFEYDTFAILCGQAKDCKKFIQYKDATLLAAELPQPVPMFTVEEIVEKANAIYENDELELVLLYIRTILGGKGNEIK